MKTFLEKLLDYYNLSHEQYEVLKQHTDNISLKDPSSFLGMDKAVNRIRSAIKNKEKIIIYGDYDCDGICATSIMVKTFKKLNYDVSYYIPSRYIDGYALNVNNVEKIAKQNFKLIICVDNGISANEAIKKAKEFGIDVIVVDHHEIPANLPDAYSIIHPIVSKVSNIIASGGYMALFLSRALIGQYDNYLVVLAGLSTISDLMELKDYNRDVVLLAIDNLNNYKYRTFMELISSPIINEKTLAIEVAPKINAIGRMIEDTSVNRLVKYLISDDEKEISQLSLWINEVNEQRKTATKVAIENISNINHEESICILADVKEGLIGLLANRLMSEYNVPSIVFTIDNKDPNMLKGSIRSKEGFNVIDAFSHLKKYLVNGGGHAQAGGLSIKKEDFNSFSNDFKEYAKSHQFVEENKKDYIEISLNDINIKNYEILRSFGPLGIGNYEPEFAIYNLPTKALKFVSGGKHLMTSLSLTTKLLGFNIEEKTVKNKEKIDIYGTLNMSEFRRIQTIEFKINKFN